MTNLKLAKAGDVIEHGQDIPANVVALQDANGGEDLCWFRTSRDPMTFEYTNALPGLEYHSTPIEDFKKRWFPLTVVEVDLEPLVLTLPEVPAEAVALVGVESGRRYEPDRGNREPGQWSDGRRSYSLMQVLQREHPRGVTVEFAPPPEPRVWPKLDGAPADISEVVEVEGHGRFRIAVRRQSGDTTYVHEDEHGATGRVTFTLGRLRELGEVREVLEP